MGEVAIVKQIHPHVPLTPVVLLVKSAGNTLLSNPHELDLCGQIETPHRSIATIQDPHHAGSALPSTSIRSHHGKVTLS